MSGNRNAETTEPAPIRTAIAVPDNSAFASPAIVSYIEVDVKV